MKRPSFQFYPADWRNNANLRRCSWAARGAWIDFLGLLHDSDEYGVLRWPAEEIVGAIGCPPALIEELVTKGVLKGCDGGQFGGHTFTPRHAGKDGEPVILVPACEGPIWFSSRFVRDEYVRQNAGKATRFVRVGEPLTAPPTPPSTPSQRDGERQGDEPSQRQGDGSTSSSSSSSTSKNKDQKQEHVQQRTAAPSASYQTRLAAPDLSPGFVAFWDTYPAENRRVDKRKCMALWRKSGFESIAGQIVANVIARKATQSWRDGFEPAPLRYLTNYRWEDGLPKTRPKGPAL